MPYWCVKHAEAPASHLCVQCGDEFCDECVVFPFGAMRGALCIGCALVLGGVRPPTLRAGRSGAEVRRRLRERGPELAELRRRKAAADEGVDPDTSVEAPTTPYATSARSFEASWSSSVGTRHDH